MKPVRPLSPASAIARRDLLEFVRDRRAVFITFLLPLIAYPIVALATVLGLRTALEQMGGTAEPLSLSVVLTGPDAPVVAGRLTDLRDSPERSALAGAAGWPASLQVSVAPSVDEALAAMTSGEAEAWIEVPPGTTRALRSFRGVELPLRATNLDVDTEQVITHLEAVIESLADAIRRERFAELQIPVSVFEPISLAVAPKIAGPSNSQAGSVISTIAGSMLMILTLLTVTGAFHPAADAFAGEKERGTIETLLVAPCAIGEVVRGKFFAVYGVTLATLLANLVAIAGTAAVGLRALPEDLQGLFSAAPSPAEVVAAVATQAALAAVAAAACLAITSSLRSLKEAHHALTTVMLAVSVLAAAGLVPMPLPQEAVAVMPVAGQVLVARLALTGETIGLLLPLTLVAAVVWCWILLKATAVALADEEVIFRGPDAAGGLLQRPPFREFPSPLQGVLPAIVGLAGVWYVQTLLPKNLVLALPLQQFFSMVLPLLALIAWQRVDLRRTLRLRLPRAAGWAAVPGAVVLGAGLFLVGAMALRWLVGDTPSAAAEELAARLTALLADTPAWLVVLVLAVIPAVCEELVFRGWMLSALSGEWPTRARQVTAVIVQAALFAVVHLLPERLPTTFAMGLVLGWVALTTRSILPGIICHAVHNAVPAGVSLLAGTSLESLEVSPLTLLGTGMLAVGIGATLVAWSGRRRAPAAATAILFLLCWSATHATAADPKPADSEATTEATTKRETVSVAVFEIEAVCWFEGEQPTGFSADLWKEIARQLDVDTEFVREERLDETVHDVQVGSVDLLLGPFAMTEAREQVIDFTHPVISSGMRIAVPKQSQSAWNSPLLSVLSWELLSVFLLVVGLLVVASHVLWLTERSTNGEVFPQTYLRGVSEAGWWAVCTIVTGGCENKPVESTAGRVVAVVWMLGSIVLVAALTGSFSAALTVERITGAIHGPSDLQGRVVATIAQSVGVEAASAYGARVAGYPDIHACFTAVESGEADAVVFERHVVEHLVSQGDHPGFSVVGPVFETFDYGMAVQQGSPLRERLNTAILAIREEGLLATIEERWYGKHD